MFRLLLLLAAVLPRTGSQLPTCVSMSNYADSQYTIGIKLGSQQQVLQVVPDTGSFELLVASTACDYGCTGGNHTYFDIAKSTSLQYGRTKENKIKGEYSSYGQGDVFSVLVSDRVGVGNLAVDNVKFLIMVQNELKNFDVAAYDGIMGIGPMATANVAGDGDAPRAALMTQLNAPVAGVCLGQSSGTRGRLDLGGGAPGLSYFTMPVTGHVHWGLWTTGLKVGGKTIGCSKPPHCAAIVDSGTSLITLPKSVITELAPLINSVKADCSNVDSLPAMQFDVGNVTFSLPPQLWVMRVADTPEVKTAEVSVPGYQPVDLPFYSGHYTDECFAALDEMDVTTDHGPMIILGVPFLRAYATVFNRTNSAARTMSFSQRPVGSDFCAGCDASSGGSGGGSSSAHAEQADASLTVLQPEELPRPRSQLQSISPRTVLRPWHQRTARHRERQEDFPL